MEDGVFIKGKYFVANYTHPSDKEGHPCYKCAFNIVNLNDYHCHSHICCNPLSPYHCINVHIPKCDKHATWGELRSFYNIMHECSE